MRNLMLDIETIGNQEDAIVISIGAVFFDPSTGDLGEEFYTKLEFQDQIDAGRRCTAQTIQWWMSQDKDAQKVFHEEGSQTLSALMSFRDFVLSNCPIITEVKPWGNGPSFDITIMETLFKDFKVDCPWKFWNVRCLRTFKEYIYNGKDLERKGVYHNALDDCKHQIRVVTTGLNKEQING